MAKEDNTDSENEFVFDNFGIFGVELPMGSWNKIEVFHFYLYHYKCVVRHVQNNVYNEENCSYIELYTAWMLVQGNQFDCICKILSY